MLQLEKEARLEGEEKVANVLDEYAVTLQRGLKIVNKSEF